MRIKALIIVGLVCAILASATAGTFSTYTVSAGGHVSIEPDAQKIREQYDARERQIQESPEEIPLIRSEDGNVK